MTPRRWLVLGGAVVVAIVVLLIIKLWPDSAATPPRRTPDRATDDSARESSARRRPRLDVERTTTPDTPVREVVIDGVRIRDHRKGNRPLPDLPITTSPPDRRRVPQHVVQDLSAQLQTVMKDCTATIAADARGAAPRLEGVVFVDIAGGELRVTEAKVQLRDILGDAGAAAKACIEDKSVGRTAVAKDAEDTSHYSITLSFAIPPP